MGGIKKERGTAERSGTEGKEEEETRRKRRCVGRFGATSRTMNFGRFRVKGRVLCRNLWRTVQDECDVPSSFVTPVTSHCALTGVSRVMVFRRREREVQN